MSSNLCTYDPHEMARRGRIGAFRQHSLYDTKTTTKAARDARWQGYLTRVDPDGTLTPKERTRRAKAARKADMAVLTRKRWP